VSFFEKLKKIIHKEPNGQYDTALEASNHTFGKGLKRLFGLGTQVKPEFYDALTKVLIESDVGLKTTQDLVNTLRKQKPEHIEEAILMLSEKVIQSFKTYPKSNAPIQIYVMVGINGAGKTTSSAKLAYRLTQEGKKVLLVGADTFRAAAGQQLKMWADRMNVVSLIGKEQADPASVVVDACKKALYEHFDIVIIDTAGRLQNKVNLMHELEKIHRVIEKTVGFRAQHVLLVLDASTGQNAISQATQFTEAVELTGIVCTKLDGSAKGGSLIALASILKLPVAYVGLGEKVEDLIEFDAATYFEAITQELRDVG
jgi:fused signal recognition particle receptor